MTIRKEAPPQVVYEDGVPLGEIYQHPINWRFVVTGADGTYLGETQDWGDAVQTLLEIPNEEGTTGNITIE